jgi:hypothetical protein
MGGSKPIAKVSVTAHFALDPDKQSKTETIEFEVRSDGFQP